MNRSAGGEMDARRRENVFWPGGPRPALIGFPDVRGLLS